MATAVKAFFTVGSGCTGNLNGSRVDANNNTTWGRMHTPPDGTATLDEVWVWLDNTHASYYCQYGIGAVSGNAYQSAPCDSSEMKFPTSSPPWMILQGALMQDDETTMGIKNEQASYGFWSGFVNRITP